MGFRWTTSMTPEEGWLNSDREILNRLTRGAGKQGVLLTLELPSGEHFQAEVDKLSAETGASFCNMSREYYNEWKAGKEASSKRKQRDREQQSILDAEGQVLRGEPDSGVLPVQETVQALKDAVHGAATLEEEVLLRIAGAEGRMKTLLDVKAINDANILALDEEYEQMMKMKEIFSASKVLEKASGGVPRTTQAGGQGEMFAMDGGPHSSETI